jgi:D-alanyl-D-alanine endopeptidase (penicillin-binding protein 7)
MLLETLIDWPRGRQQPPGRTLPTGWARRLGFVAAFAVALGLTAPAASAKSLRKPPVRVAAKKKARRPVRERPVPVYTRAGLPNIQARAALILDVTDGAVARSPLYQKNPDEVRPIASISKLMAMLVVLEHKLDLAAKTTITEADARLAARGAKSRLLTGMTLTNRDLLYAALLASDNRAVLALGRAVGLSPAEHAAQMTARARALGLTRTQFMEPTGLDYRNVSTPREVIVFLQAALKNPLIAQACRTTQHTAHAELVGRSPKQPLRHAAIEYTSTDLLLRASKHVIHGGKTGYNDRAGYCLVVAARVPAGTGPKGERREREVAMAFLGEEGELTRFADFGRAAQWLEERKPLLTSENEAQRPPAPAPASTRLHARNEQHRGPM